MQESKLLFRISVLQKERLLSYAHHPISRIFLQSRYQYFYLSSSPPQTTLPLCPDAEVNLGYYCSGRGRVHRSLKGASLEATEKKNLEEKCGKGVYAS